MPFLTYNADVYTLPEVAVNADVLEQLCPEFDVFSITLSAVYDSSGAFVKLEIAVTPVRVQAYAA